MEGLRPERDELDRFNSRQVKQKKGKKQKSKDRDEGSRSGMLFFIAFMLLAVCVALGWAVMQQQSQINALENQLGEASGFINQSKLLMARFEGELSEADAEAQQSGSVVAKKLAFLDSEMRKLWGVSNDRNKKAIKANDQAIDKLAKTVGSVKKDLSESSKKLEKQQGQQGKTIADSEKKLTQLDAIVKSTASEVAITREIINEEIDLMKFAIESSEALEGSIKENKQAIASIDASRLQLNERIVSLESQLNQLRLNLETLNRQSTVKAPMELPRDVVVDVQ